ncbi:hypothetical protein [Halovenus sp. HT40]|uniref:hypothetical protein n=1 Tax=Halovenus sp. HT40 TaxID=3126691 RepID=UPI00300EAFA8
MKRRTALQLGGSMLLATTAGCSVPQGGTSSDIEISKINLRSYLDRAVEASVMLVDSDEVVLWRTVTLSTGQDRFATLDELPAQAGEYTLYAHIPGTDTGDAVQVDLTEDVDEKDLSCIVVELVIDPTFSGERHLSYNYIAQCESES